MYSILKKYPPRTPTPTGCVGVVYLDVIIAHRPLN